MEHTDKVFNKHKEIAMHHHHHTFMKLKQLLKFTLQIGTQNEKRFSTYQNDYQV